jgi:TPR repeat protein
MSHNVLVGGFLAAVWYLGWPIGAPADQVSEGDSAYYNGDYSKAKKILMPQARRGNSVAQRDIGNMYFDGVGFVRNSREAVKWFTLSARQGQLAAQVDLGIAYATGEGVRPSSLQAYVWFSAAASQQPGVKTVAAHYREYVALKLSPDQLQLAQGAATRCQATNYEDCSAE